MAKEIERKFLVSRSRWRDLVEAEIRIRQFYLAAAPGRSVRIRISDGATAMLTLKFSGEGRGRDEFEYPVPLADAEEMQAFALGQCDREDPPPCSPRRLSLRGRCVRRRACRPGDRRARDARRSCRLKNCRLARPRGHAGGAVLQRIACARRGSGVRSMSYRIDPRQPLTSEVRRIAAEEIDERARASCGRARRSGQGPA